MEECLNSAILVPIGRCSLLDLVMELWPQPFSDFVVEVFQPNRSNSTGPSQIEVVSSFAVNQPEVTFRSASRLHQSNKGSRCHPAVCIRIPPQELGTMEANWKGVVFKVEASASSASESAMRRTHFKARHSFKN